MQSTYATYSPEDNRLRLYVGRVPRETFLPRHLPRLSDRQFRGGGQPEACGETMAAGASEIQAVEIDG